MAERHGTRVITDRVRLSYVTITQPRDYSGNGNAKYSVSVLIPKSSEQTVKAINEAVKAATEAGRERYGVKWPGRIINSPLRDGDTDRPNDPAYKGCYFINATSKRQPQCVDSDRNRIDPREVYSGVYGRVSINLYPYDRNGNRGVAAGLNNIQSYGVGDPLGGASTAEDDFASSEPGADEYDFLN